MTKIKEIMLTKREAEVLQLLPDGMTRDQIAARLHITPETVKMHLKNIYRKLNAKNRIEALIKAKIIT